jgi:ketosteroid isomerase-like protein
MTAGATATVTTAAGPIAHSDLMTEATLQTIDAFNDAFNRRDVDAVMALMTDDCVFENTWPAPDGERYEGQAAVRAFWQRLFTGARSTHFAVEDLFAAGDRATQCWRYTWVDEQGTPGHVRGVDVFRVRDGKVAEKLSYVKG